MASSCWAPAVPQSFSRLARPRGQCDDVSKSVGPVVGAARDMAHLLVALVPGRFSGPMKKSTPRRQPSTVTAERVAFVDELLDTATRIHPEAAAWRIGRDCYLFIAEVVRPGWRTLETGCGLSTVCLTAWGCEHLAVTPSPGSATALWLTASSTASAQNPCLLT